MSMHCVKTFKMNKQLVVYANDVLILSKKSNDCKYMDKCQNNYDELKKPVKRVHTV